MSRRRVFAVVGALLVLTGVGWLLNALVGIDTNLLWFRAIDHESAYTRRFWTEALLFVTFGALMAAAVAHTLVVAVRQRPDFNPDPTRQRWRYLFSRIERRLRKPLFVVIVAVLSVMTGGAAASGWQTWLLWRNRVPVGRADPQFHRDLSYFLFVYPQHRMVLNLLFRVIGTAIVVLLVTAYGYGALRIRGKGPRLTRALQIHLSALLGIYLVLKVFGYWLDRLATATSNRGVVTGPGYTDVHAVLPGKLILLVIAAICAALMFGNVAAQSNKLMLWTLGVMAGSALVIGVALPRVVQQFWEKPSAALVEKQYIQRNINATRTAFGVDNVSASSLAGAPTTSGTDLLAGVRSADEIRLLDPNRMSPTFTVLQQQRSFYGFKSTLDLDHYTINGREHDVEIALRELNLSGLPKSQRSWTNQHFVYTHGYGVVAADTDVTHNGQPVFVAGDVPQNGAILVREPRVYYGLSSPSYSIVGTPHQEIDRPSSSGSGDVTTMHIGGGGVPVGGFFHRLLYTWKLRSSSILFSSQIHPGSQLLYNRNPLTRVSAVAPWLKLDGDAYPVVVDGQVDWVVDGYTTSNSYPYSQQINLRSATTTTLNKNGASVLQPSTSINYMRNSVKAVVNAYTGAVTLYAWNGASDPVLQTWEKAFPGLIRPQTSIPASLLPHLRYPTDLFNVQRTVLARYHLTDPSQFYSGSDFWKVPYDPTVNGGTKTTATGGTVSTPPPPQPSAYFTMSETGMVTLAYPALPPGANTPPPPAFSQSIYSLSSPMVTLNRRNLAAFLSVDSEPGPDYGHFTLLELPSSSVVDAPSQIQNDIESTPRIANALSLERAGSSKVVLANLITIPLDGQILYVEPIYTQSTGGNPYPILRHVAAVYGNGPVGFGPTLDGALRQAFGVTATSPGRTPR
ncbi:MAG TPA: UPF0182 family protein [Mycobacteriales bacterium]|nr:UPF0182 family protein [Mycobacteriales bacterium]